MAYGNDDCEEDLEIIGDELKEGWLKLFYSCNFVI